LRQCRAKRGPETERRPRCEHCDQMCNVGTANLIDTDGLSLGGPRLPPPTFASQHTRWCLPSSASTHALQISARVGHIPPGPHMVFAGLPFPRIFAQARLVPQPPSSRRTRWCRSAWPRNRQSRSTTGSAAMRAALCEPCLGPSRRHTCGSVMPISSLTAGDSLPSDHLRPGRSPAQAALAGSIHRLARIVCMSASDPLQA